MKIGIDISQIAYEGTGVANYTRNLVENLLEIDKKNEYILFFSSLRKKSQILNLKSQNQSVKLKTFKIPPTLLDFFWNRLHILPVENLIGKVDIFHSSDWTQPPTKAKKITTIHDLTPLKFPETLHPKIVQTHKRRLNWVKKECDMVICVSKSTQKDVVELLGIPEEKTKVIYEGVGKEFEEFRIMNYELRIKKIKVVKEKYGVHSDYILSVGTREPRKNIERLIEAYNNLIRQLADSNISLVIAGKYGWGDKEIKNQKSKIKNLGYVPQEDLPALYIGSRCFIYPSLYEGFGLPVLEAMSVGCPVVTSNTSSLPEVGGTAAIYCDPYSIESIREAMNKVLKLKGPELKKLKNDCLSQASKFSWKKAAEETLAIYEEVLK